MDPPEFHFGPSFKTSMSEIVEAISESQNDDRNVRTRSVHGYGLIPYDNQFLPSFSKEVSVKDMMGTSPERKKSVLFLQLIRIVSGSNSGQTMTSYQSYLKKNKEASASSHYYRLFLFRDASSKDGQVVYMVEGKNRNDKLWTRNPMRRDDGTVTIGTYICVMNPHPILSTWCNEIPIIECRGSAFVMRSPPSVMEVGIDDSITANCTQSFVLNNVKIDISSLDIHPSKCSGLFCDRQRTMDIDRGTRSCGCYSMNSRVGCIVLVHSVTFTPKRHAPFVMEDFSSLSFSSLYLKDPIPPSVKVNQLDYTESYFKLSESADNVVEHINSKGGFTVVGWYKRGEINDQSNDDSQNEVESSEVMIHVVSIFPTDKTVLNDDIYKQMKFDIADPDN